MVGNLLAQPFWNWFIPCVLSLVGFGLYLLLWCGVIALYHWLTDPYYEAHKDDWVEWR